VTALLHVLDASSKHSTSEVVAVATT
jgi:hypothetical protein